MTLGAHQVRISVHLVPKVTRWQLECRCRCPSWPFVTLGAVHGPDLPVMTRLAARSGERRAAVFVESRMTVRAPQASAENMSLVIELGSSKLHLLSFYSAMTLETDVLTYGQAEINLRHSVCERTGTHGLLHQTQGGPEELVGKLDVVCSFSQSHEFHILRCHA